MKFILAAILAALVWALPASANHLKSGNTIAVSVWCLSEKIIDEVMTGKRVPGCWSSPMFYCVFIKYGKTHPGKDGKSRFRVLSCKPLNPTVNQGKPVWTVERVK